MTFHVKKRSQRAYIHTKPRNRPIIGPSQTSHVTRTHIAPLFHMRLAKHPKTMAFHPPSCDQNAYFAIFSHETPKSSHNQGRTNPSCDQNAYCATFSHETPKSSHNQGRTTPSCDQNAYFTTFSHETPKTSQNQGLPNPSCDQNTYIQNTYIYTFSHEASKPIHIATSTADNTLLPKARVIRATNKSNPQTDPTTYRTILASHSPALPS